MKLITDKMQGLLNATIAKKQAMKCPNCGFELNPAAILGKAGGKKSRRVLTPEQAKAMVGIREQNRKELTK